MTSSVRIPVSLGGVPETLLWTLYERAAEARRADAVLHDPLAVELVDAIDYPFEQRFGPPRLGQWQALRARCFDREVHRFLARYPHGTVVALGEGLETQFWRVDNGRVRWLSVELPETTELRRRLLPAPRERRREVEGSALDERWMDEVDSDRGVLVSAQGLLMYLEPAQVRRLIAACAERFAGQQMVFDAVPRWFAASTMRGGMRTSGGYHPPPMPWFIDAAERRRLAALRGVAELEDLRLPPGRGVLLGSLLPAATRLGAVRLRLLSVMRARFAAAP